MNKDGFYPLRKDDMAGKPKPMRQKKPTIAHYFSPPVSIQIVPCISEYIVPPNPEQTVLPILR